jgi:hypothetical protein
VVVGLLLLAPLVGCSDDDGDDDARDDTDTTTDDSPAPDDGGDERDGDSDSEEDAPLTDALTDEIRASFTDQGVGDELPEDEAQCAADAIVDQIGAERLAELGVTAADAAALEAVIRDPANGPEREAIATALSDCVDLVRTIGAIYGAIGLSESSATCVAEGIVADADLRRTLLLGDEPQGQVVDRFDALAAACFTPEEQQMFGPDAGSAPTTAPG